MTDIEDLKRLAEAATPGPWYWDADPVKGDPLERRRAQVVATGRTITQGYYTGDQGEKDAAFIAAANPQTILALIRELEEARSLNRRALEYLKARAEKMGGETHTESIPGKLLADLRAARPQQR